MQLVCPSLPSCSPECLQLCREVPGHPSPKILVTDPMHHSLQGSLVYPSIWSGSHRPLLLPPDSPCCLCLAENTMLQHSVVSWALTHRVSLIHYISNKNVKAVLHDEIHKVMNDLLCVLLTYLHTGIMKCKLGKLYHTGHQENLFRNMLCHWVMSSQCCKVSQYHSGANVSLGQRHYILSKGQKPITHSSSYLRTHESSATLLWEHQSSKSV